MIVMIVVKININLTLKSSMESELGNESNFNH
jgi:hypothetical protein